MTITTSTGKTFDVNWAWAPRNTNRLRIEMHDTRTIKEIAEDFDGLESISRKSETEGDDVYMGYKKLTGVNQDTVKGTVQLTLERSETDV